MTPPPMAYAGTPGGNMYSRIFVEPDEQYIASLGDNYLASFLTTQRIKRCMAYLSDKRVYLRGNIVDLGRRRISRTNIQQTVDLEDITGTGFIFSSPAIWKLVVAILCVPVAIGAAFIPDTIAGFISGAVLIAGVIFALLYFLSRKTYFFIEYAGGGIKFECAIYGVAESRDFEKQIRRAKNALKGAR